MFDLGRKPARRTRIVMPRIGLGRMAFIIVSLGFFNRLSPVQYPAIIENR
jgi:hypothetical protein